MNILISKYCCGFYNPHGPFLWHILVVPVKEMCASAVTIHGGLLSREDGSRCAPRRNNNRVTLMGLVFAGFYEDRKLGIPANADGGV